MDLIVPETHDQLLAYCGIYVTAHSIASHPRKNRVKNRDVESYFVRLQSYLRELLLPEEFEHVKIFCNGEMWELVHRQNVIFIMQRGLFNFWSSKNQVSRYFEYRNPIRATNKQ